MSELTRRQRQVLALLEAGHVAELERPKSGRAGSERYILRGPNNHETDGPTLLHATVNALLLRHLANRVRIPSMDKTWVFGKQFYERNATAFEVLTAESPPRTTNHPPPRFRTL